LAMLAALYELRQFHNPATGTAQTPSGLVDA
jgi:hypothetical protein